MPPSSALNLTSNTGAFLKGQELLCQAQSSPGAPRAVCPGCDPKQLVVGVKRTC